LLYIVLDYRQSEWSLQVPQERYESRGGSERRKKARMFHFRKGDEELEGSHKPWSPCADSGGSYVCDLPRRAQQGSPSQNWWSCEARRCSSWTAQGRRGEASERGPSASQNHLTPTARVQAVSLPPTWWPEEVALFEKGIGRVQFHAWPMPFLKS